MSNQDREYQIYKIVKSFIEEDPSYIEIIMKAITAGMNDKINKMRIEYSETNAALICALSLVKDKRITKENKERLNKVILRGITHDYDESTINRLSLFEQDIIKQYNDK